MFRGKHFSIIAPPYDDAEFFVWRNNDRRPPREEDGGLEAQPEPGAMETFGGDAVAPDTMSISYRATNSARVSFAGAVAQSSDLEIRESSLRDYFQCPQTSSLQPSRVGMATDTTDDTEYGDAGRLGLSVASDSMPMDVNIDTLDIGGIVPALPHPTVPLNWRNPILTSLPQPTVVPFSFPCE